MYERKIWIPREDQTLKELKQVRKMEKWSEIARVMRQEFQIFGRNGKQCRQRYTNHLDSRIIKQKWSAQQENKLLDLHNKLGNRWAAISRELPGRTDNCVKNHFYSCFRKGIKVANTLINNLCKKKFRPFKNSIIGKIVSITEAHHRESSQLDLSRYNQAMNIKYHILMFRSENESVSKENVVTKLEQLSKSIIELNKNCRKKLVKKKSYKMQQDESEELKNRLFEQKDLQQQQNQNDNQSQKHNRNEFFEEKDELIQTQEGVKEEGSQVKKIDGNNKSQHLNKAIQTIEQTPMKNLEKEERMKNSSYCSLKSIDYLDGKIFHNYSAKEFMMDDEKQWKLYFE